MFISLNRSLLAFRRRIFISAELPSLKRGVFRLLQILVPIPQYPLYSATIQLLGGTLVPYYLTEEDNWSMNINELQKSVTAARRKGISVRFSESYCYNFAEVVFLGCCMLSDSSCSCGVRILLWQTLISNDIYHASTDTVTLTMQDCYLMCSKLSLSC